MRTGQQQPCKARTASQEWPARYRYHTAAATAGAKHFQMMHVRNKGSLSLVTSAYVATNGFRSRPVDTTSALTFNLQTAEPTAWRVAHVQRSFALILHTASPNSASHIASQSARCHFSCNRTMTTSNSVRSDFTCAS